MSAMLDASGQALELMSQQASPGGRRQLALLVHGNDTNSSLTTQALIARAGDDAVTIHVISLGDEADASTLAEITQATGGLFASCDNAAQMAKIFSELQRLMNGPRFVYRMRVTFKPSGGLVSPGTDWLFNVDINDEYRAAGYNSVPIKITIPS
jgi:hypothetical protein